MLNFSAIILDFSISLSRYISFSIIDFAVLLLSAYTYRVTLPGGLTLLYKILISG